MFFANLQLIKSMLNKCSAFVKLCVLIYLLVIPRPSSCTLRTGVAAISCSSAGSVALCRCSNSFCRCCSTAPDMSGGTGVCAARSTVQRRSTQRANAVLRSLRGELNGVQVPSVCEIWPQHKLLYSVYVLVFFSFCPQKLLLIGYSVNFYVFC